MRAWIEALALLLLWVAPGTVAERLEVWPPVVEQGQPILVRAFSGAGQGGAELSLLGRRAHMAPGGRAAAW